MSARHSGLATLKPVLTVTLNSALDRVLVLDRFVAGETNRAVRSLEAIGGKGFDVSLALTTLGVNTLAIGLVAGDTGRRLAGLLKAAGVRHLLVEGRGATRTATVLVELLLGRHSHITDHSLSAEKSHWRRLYSAVTRELPRSRLLVLAGSVAPGLPLDSYARLLQAAHRARRPALVDASGPPLLAALSEVAGGDTIVKLNHQELIDTFGATGEPGTDELTSLEALADRAEELRDRYGASSWVITAGARGIAAATPEGRYLAHPLEVAVRNAAGAGDAATAGLLARLDADGWQGAVAEAAAVAAAVCLTEQTAVCMPQDLARLRTEARVTRL